MTYNIHKSWLPFFKSIHPKFRAFISNLNPDTYFPEKENIYQVFKMPLSKIQIVILGQDPYPRKGQSIGLAFAVSKNTAKPVSFRIIEKEIGKPLDRTLSNWIEQGVFLLNTALTVKRNNSGTHIRLWEYFTKKLIYHISSNQNVIWLLWGRHAQLYIPYIQNRTYGFEVDKNIILTAAHPAAESYKNNAGFLGCNHFNIVNDILVKKNKNKINW
jgi:uracil-DNA glycosylase